jgi:hypothetical protein
MVGQNSSTKIACSLAPAEERALKKKLETELIPHVISRAQMADGICLAFRQVPGLQDTLERLVELDKGCCTFLDHEIELQDQTITMRIRSEGQGVALAQAFLNDAAMNNGYTSSGNGLKLMLLAAACGVACAAPWLFAGLGIGGSMLSAGTLGIEFLVLGVLGTGAGAYFLYKRKSLFLRGRKKNADRCGC